MSLLACPCLRPTRSTIALLLAATMLAPAGVAAGQTGSTDDAKDATWRSEPMSLSYAAADPPDTEPPVESTTTEPAEEKREPYDLLTTKRLTGDWGGVRTWMDEHYADLSIIYVGVWQQNFRGGIETHNADDFSGDLRLNLYLDLDKMNLVKGGFFFARAKSSYNDSVRGNVGALTSTAWVIANGDHEFYLDKWWYGQRFLDDKFEFRIGKLLTPIDLFDSNLYAQSPWDQFINAALCCNSTFPHRKAYGAFLKFRPTDWFYFQMAGLDADQRDANRCASFDTAFHEGARYIGMWELGLTPSFKSVKGGLPGNYRVGWYYDPRILPEFQRPDTRPAYRKSRGDDIGCYLSFDQMVWKENDEPKDKQGVGAFCRYGYANQDINAVSNFWSLGAQYQGLIPKRDEDVLAFGVAQSAMSNKLRHNVNTRADRETVYEVYYAIHLTPWCVLTPDIQVITNPGGNKDARDSIVGSIRLKLSL